jgi:hypothetical protein
MTFTKGARVVVTPAPPKLYSHGGRNRLAAGCTGTVCKLNGSMLLVEFDDGPLRTAWMRKEYLEPANG